MIIDYQIAKQELLTSDKDRCQQFFEANGNHLELGYFYLFNENLPAAKTEFEKIVDLDIRAHWAKFMVELLQGNVSYYPSYFELRNFFEIDLDLLIKHFKGNYVETLVNYSDFMSSINPEVCKFIGRVFLYNGYMSHAFAYFKQAKDKFYRDPELHYLICEYYISQNDYENAKKSAQICLEVLPKYFPAEQMLKKLEAKL